MEQRLIIIMIVWNLITFLMMGIDKYKSIRGMWRISEKTLLTVAFAMGAFGSIVGSTLWRHKTKTWKFRILLPIALIFNLAVIFLIWYYII
ncbi:MAG: DUF1294 domain-containing protein [Anaerovoracaceae bacterium]|jgi:uncharacterized membrane protein YsdA (DUF1294 family)